VILSGLVINPFLPFTARKLLYLMKVVEKILDWENAGKMKFGVILSGKGFPPGTSRHGFSNPPVGDVMVTRAPPSGDPLLALFVYCIG